MPLPRRISARRHGAREDQESLLDAFAGLGARPYDFPAVERDAIEVFAGSGMLFVASGYGGFRQPPGNVLLAFRPKARTR